MQPLKDTLARFRRDLADALAADAAAPAPWRLAADRATLELNVVLDSGAWRVVEASDTPAHPGQVHRVTVEFALGATTEPAGRSGMSRHGLSVEAPSAAPPAGADPASLAGRLADVFGAPGFDSSARATVFREALEGLSAAEVRAAISSAGQAVADDASADVRRAAHLLGRLVQSGPAGMEHGREILADVSRQTDPSELIGLVERLWKTQDDWIDRP